MWGLWGSDLTITAPQSLPPFSPLPNHEMIAHTRTHTWKKLSQTLTYHLSSSQQDLWVSGLGLESKPRAESGPRARAGLPAGPWSGPAAHRGQRGSRFETSSHSVSVERTTVAQILERNPSTACPRPNTPGSEERQLRHLL